MELSRIGRQNNFFLSFFDGVGNKSDSYQDLKESNNRLQIEMDDFKNEVNSKLVEIMNHLTSSSIKGVDMRQLNSPASKGFY